MKRLIAPAIAGLLSVACSPLLVTHACGLSSWPLEWTLALGFAISAVALVYRLKKKWLRIAVVIAAPLVSLGATLAYGDWIHSDAFPEWLLDHSGKEWRARSHPDKEPIQQPQQQRP